MDVFSAVSDPTRRRMLELLSEREHSVGELARALPGRSQPLISAHLKALRSAELVSVRADAQRRVYALRPEGLREVDRWIARYRRFWPERLDALETHLDSNPE